MTFSEIVNTYLPKHAIRVKVGDTETYIGKYCRGLCEMKKEQIEWLDTHTPIRTSMSWNEITLTYRKSEKYTNIVWG